MNQSDDAALLRQKGHRLTPQRLMVLDVIKRGGSHLTVEEIHAAILPQQPYINIATVYRSLQWLEQVGLVAPVMFNDGPLRYEYINGARHHHLICRSCGHELEISDDILDTLKAQLLERYGFALQVNHVGLPGRCEACRQAEQGSECHNDEETE